MSSQIMQEIETKDLRAKNQQLERELDRQHKNQQCLKQQLRSQDLLEQQNQQLAIRIKKLQDDLDALKMQNQNITQELQNTHMKALADRQEHQIQIELIQQYKLDHEEAQRTKDDLIKTLTLEVSQASEEVIRSRKVIEAHDITIKRLNEQLQRKNECSRMLAELRVHCLAQEKRLAEFDQVMLRSYEQTQTIERLQQSEKILRQELEVSQAALKRQQNHLQKSFEEQSMLLTLAKDDFARKSRFIVKEMLSKENTIKSLEKKMKRQRSYDKSTQNLSLILQQISNNNNTPLHHRASLDGQPTTKITLYNPNGRRCSQDSLSGGMKSK